MAKEVYKKFSSPNAVKWFWRIICAPVAVTILLLLLIRIGTFGKLPSFEELENPKSNLATKIYSEDGDQIGSFFIQNRSYVNYEDISPNLVAALVGTEDIRFYSHSGIDFIALARVAVRTIGLGQGQGGGSTISQQVAKNLYPRDENLNNNALTKPLKLVIAKLKEWITAVMLEHNYTKEEIIAMYLNTMEYGSNAFGIESAAKTFFNKTPDQINAQEAAILIGVVNAPTRFSPVRNPQRALERRNTVLSRMKNVGYLTSAQRDSLSGLPIELNYKPISHNEGIATYFREMIRITMRMDRPTRRQFNNDWDYEQAVKQWDNNPIYGFTKKFTKNDGTPYDIDRDGLKIYTTLNSRMQRYAEEALMMQMRTSVQPKMDGQVRTTGRIFDRNLSQAQIDTLMWNAIRYSDRGRALMNDGVSRQEIMKIFKTPVEMSVFTYKGDRDTTMTPYDSILHYKKQMRSSFVAIDPSNGHVKAYVGGPSFRHFKYDMGKQGKRQIGSTIKPFIYSYAIDQLGLSPCTMVPNLVTTIEIGDGNVWQPREASAVEYDGALHPLYWGLYRSRNNYTAWIMKQARQPQAVADYIHKLGLNSWIDPVYSLVLGVSDFSLYELTGAYCTFANRGVYTEPIFVTRIEDRFGNVIADFTATSHSAISEQSAYTMLGMLERVVRNGTAFRLNGMVDGQSVAAIGGKTGTSQNSADAWYVGVLPKLVAGAWVGGENYNIHFNSGGEGAAMALPIYGEFLKKVYADPTLGIYRTDRFPIPVGAVTYDCDEQEAFSSSSNYANDEFFD